jgi:hypothetical protein
MTLHEIQLEFERIYAERYAYDDDTSGARLHALRAVAPALIAQGLLEALPMVVDGIDRHDSIARILKRAQELDPK